MGFGQHDNFTVNRMMKRCMMAEKQSDEKQVKRSAVFWLLLLFFLLGGWMLASGWSPQGEKVELFNDRSAQIIGADSLRNGICAGLCLDGQGQIIGMADSGIDQGKLGQLPEDLQTELNRKPRIVYLQSVSGGTTEDVSGHGTHMAGIVVGNGAASNGRYQGIAPGASLYFQALANERGTVVLPKNLMNLFNSAYNTGVRIHIDGWGEPGNFYGNRTDTIDEFTGIHPDFLAVFSAGNDGPAAGTLTMEANSKNALVVGSSQIPRPAISADAADALQVSHTSSCGPTADGRIKPELLVPGSAVVSVASSLIKSNFPANPAYTVMGGSSMAAAAAGGSAALLTQYLQQADAGFRPSSALLKALLIQGARKTGLDERQYGFGILDMTTTVLSLHHRQVRWEDCTEALRQGESRYYDYEVKDSAQPLTVTLVWTDPSGSPGLLNDLDLQVVAPDGALYYGNDFSHRWVKDDVNTVEQITLPSPIAGNYKIWVSADRITGISGSQPYAVAYGQNIASDTVESVRGDVLNLENHPPLNSKTRSVVCYTQGKPDDSQQVKVGSQVYWTDNTLYIEQGQWEENGVQLIQDTNGIMITSINSLIRNGGYYMNESWLKEQETKLSYNGEMRTVQQIPDGAAAQAVVNPVSQTLYQVQLKGTEVKGRIEKLEAGKLYLTGDAQAYDVSEMTAVCYTNTEVEGAPEARPFGYMDRASIEKIVPGMQACLLIEESTRQVYAVELERPTVFDRVQAIDRAGHTITLAEGKVYGFSERTQVWRDRAASSLSALEAGQWIGGVLRKEDETSELLSLQIMDQILLGKILYFSTSSRMVYLLDQKNQFRNIPLSEDVLILRGRAEIGGNAVNEGSWVRVVLDGRTGCAERLDIASGVREEMAVVQEYDVAQRILRLTSGAWYTVQESTLFVREGSVVSAANLMAGETVKLVILPGNSRSDTYVARVELQTAAGQGSLFRNLEAHYLDDKVVVVGETSANTVQIYRADGTVQTIPVPAYGSFAVLLEQQPQEESLRICALDSRNTDADMRRIEIEEFTAAPFVGGFQDIAGSIYKNEIASLKTRGILSGYPDGNFYPNEPINRIGFLTLLVQATGKVEISLEGVKHFQDGQEVPWWALPIVNTIWQRGWKTGFEDRRIHPFNYMYQYQAQALLSNCTGADRIQFPNLRGGYLTREEAAVLIYRLLEAQGK